MYYTCTVHVLVPSMDMAMHIHVIKQLISSCHTTL